MFLDYWILYIFWKVWQRAFQKKLIQNLAADWVYSCLAPPGPDTTQAEPKCYNQLKRSTESSGNASHLQFWILTISRLFIVVKNDLNIVLKVKVLRNLIQLSDKFTLVHLQCIHLSLMQSSGMRVRAPRPEKAAESESWNEGVDCSNSQQPAESGSVKVKVWKLKCES